MKSDSQEVRDLLIAVGIVMLIATAIPGGAGANPAWTNLVTELTTGPSFPSNGQPFALQSAAVNLPIISNGTWGLSSSSNTFGNNAVSPAVVFNNGTGPFNCDSSHGHFQWWQCITTDDGSASLVGITGVTFTNISGVEHNGYQFIVQLGNISGVNPKYPVLNITVNTKCNTQTSNPVAFNVDFLQTTRTFGQKPPYTPVAFPNVLSIAQAVPVSGHCQYGGPPGPFGTNWFPVRSVSDFQNGIMVSNLLVGNLSGVEMLVSSTTWDQSVYFTYMSVTVNYLVDNTVNNKQCGNLDIGCVVANIWNTVSTWLAFAAQQAIFAGQWLWALVTFFVSLIVNFVIGFILAIIWLYTMPGFHVPTAVLAILDIWWTAVLGMLFYNVLKIIRGGGGT